MNSVRGILAALVFCAARGSGRLLSMIEMGHWRCASGSKCFNVTLAEELCACAELVTGQLEHGGSLGSEVCRPYNLLHS